MEIISKVLTALSRSQFNRIYPGPYACFEDRDGVDNVINVVCLTSDRTVISCYYWDAKDNATLTASTVAAALNMAAGFGDRADRKYSNQIRELHLSRFLERNTSPFRVRSESCPYYGMLWNILCGEESVIFRVSWGSCREAKLTAVTIADALNRLRQQ